MTRKILQPQGWPRPRGYVNGIVGYIGSNNFKVKLFYRFIF